MRTPVATYNTELHGFLYTDYEYFAWFAGKKKRKGKKDRFVAVFRWKGLHRAYNPEEVWENWKNPKLDDFGLTTYVFLKHLDQPIKFPILDKNVWAAVKKKLEPNISPRKNPIKQDYESYQRFFDTLYKNNKDNINCPTLQDISKEIVKRRVLDRALWEYGRMLLADDIARNAR